MGKKNKSGKYRGRVQIGVDRDGKPINKYVCASTMRELEQKKEEIRQHYIEGVPIREDMPFYNGPHVKTNPEKIIVNQIIPY